MIPLNVKKGARSARLQAAVAAISTSATDLHNFPHSTAAWPVGTFDDESEADDDATRDQAREETEQGMPGERVRTRESESQRLQRETRSWRKGLQAWHASFLRQVARLTTVPGISASCPEAGARRVPFKSYPLGVARRLTGTRHPLATPESPLAWRLTLLPGCRWRWARPTEGPGSPRRRVSDECRHWPRNPRADPDRS